MSPCSFKNDNVNVLLITIDLGDIFFPKHVQALGKTYKNVRLNHDLPIEILLYKLY